MAARFAGQIALAQFPNTSRATNLRHDTYGTTPLNPPVVALMAIFCTFSCDFAIDLAQLARTPTRLLFLQINCSVGSALRNYLGAVEGVAARTGDPVLGDVVPRESGEDVGTGAEFL
jgi:hypothetical protein